MIPRVDTEFPGSEVYSAAYYGVGGTIANYVNYGPSSVPHWSLPLATWLAANADGPFLDVGAAYGHLCRDLRRLGESAWAIEWSAWAYEHRVTPGLVRGDARELPWDDASFRCVTSLDLLEHFEPADTERVIAEMVRVAKPGALFVHLIGAHNPAEDLSRHLSDPTHRNHHPLEWYGEVFARHGKLPVDELLPALRYHPAWAVTDWSGRWVVVR